MAMFFCLVLSTVLETSLSLLGRRLIYGKYYSDWEHHPAKNFDDNSYWIYTPPRNLLHVHTQSAPLVMHFYGNDWKLGSGPLKSGSPLINQMVSNGMAVASIGYRRITCHYWHDVASNEIDGRPVRTPEEFINIDNHGWMSLDTTGKTFKDYKVRIARHEMLTKPFYDSVVALEHLENHALEFGIDMHRVFFWCFSAGGSMAQYLTYVYHSWHIDEFTPKGMSHDSAMLDLPTANALDRVWTLIERNSFNVEETKLMDLIPKNLCWSVVGNGCDDPRTAKFFSPDLPYSTCNSTWNQVALQRYCGSGFENVTVGQLKHTQVWLEDSEFAKGIAKLWYPSLNMWDHHPKPFHVHMVNTRDNDGLRHSPFYVMESKKIFDIVGIQYALYYDPVRELFEPPNQVESIMLSNGQQAKYVSNHDWYGQLEAAGLHAGAWTELVTYACLALELQNCSPVHITNTTSSSQSKVVTDRFHGEELQWGYLPQTSVEVPIPIHDSNKASTSKQHRKDMLAELAQADEAARMHEYAVAHHNAGRRLVYV